VKLKRVHGHPLPYAYGYGSQFLNFDTPPSGLDGVKFKWLKVKKIAHSWGDPTFTAKQRSVAEQGLKKRRLFVLGRSGEGMKKFTYILARQGEAS
jgi:hypothetical protein